MIQHRKQFVYIFGKTNHSFWEMKYLLSEFKEKHKDILKLIKTKLEIDDELEKTLKKLLDSIKEKFVEGLEK